MIKITNQSSKEGFVFILHKRDSFTHFLLRLEKWLGNEVACLCNLHQLDPGCWSVETYEGNDQGTIFSKKKYSNKRGTGD